MLFFYSDMENIHLLCHTFLLQIHFIFVFVDLKKMLQILLSTHNLRAQHNVRKAT